MSKIPTNTQWNDLANRIKAKLNVSDLINYLYPVGSYFVTSDLSFNPATLWGGTWEISGQVLSEGGEAWDAFGEVWDTVGGVWKLDGVIVNRWHRTA